MVSPRLVGGPHYVASCLPRPGGAVAHGVADALGAACRGEGHVVFPLPLVHPRPFLVVFGPLVELDNVSRVRNHVFVQFHVVDVGVSPVHVSLPVVVNHHRGVYVVPVLTLPYERLAQRVFEWSVWRIGHENANAVSVDGAVHVVFAVSVHHLFGPRPIVVLSPGEVVERCHGPVVCPVHHVGRRVQQPVFHLEALGVVLVVGGVKVDGVVGYQWGGVGRILCLYDRALAQCRGGRQCRHGKRKYVSHFSVWIGLGVYWAEKLRLTKGRQR